MTEPFRVANPPRTELQERFEAIVADTSASFAFAVDLIAREALTRYPRLEVAIMENDADCSHGAVKRTEIRHMPLGSTMVRQTTLIGVVEWFLSSDPPRNEVKMTLEKTSPQ